LWLLTSEGDLHNFNLAIRNSRYHPIIGCIKCVRTCLVGINVQKDLENFRNMQEGCKYLSWLTPEKKEGYFEVCTFLELGILWIGHNTS